ncbi:hypothetical protein [Nitrosomonas sp. Nm166]|uniref:hypothetical protein n=1 Tax=Nitrosomonas sp. Nm166 TaxID=1881054 RepID=UPI0008E416F0|nr:hypothetical protein [Nitrosomonas sp. Nm166]SFE60890.1 hypothetical protein SAMN05428977_102212 [Nitrosomonas sp. Nm166]
MKMLTCSRLSSYLLDSSKRLGRWLVLLLIIFAGAVQAQGFDPKKVQAESDRSSAKWLQASELPAEASGSDTTKKKSGLVNSAVNWFRNTNLPADLQIHGFASQAYITTSDNDVFGNSDNGGSFGLTEAGLNASIRPLPRLQISAQVLSRRAGKGNSGMPRLDYAFLDYRLYSHEVNQFGIRIGRLKNPFGFYNDTRDVAFTRPGILLPQSIYFDRTRNLGLSGDSVQLYGETAVANIGTVSTQFGVWWPIVSDKDTELSILGALPRGQLNREVSFIGRGIFETNDKRLRLGISGIWLNTSYDPEYKSNDPVGPGSFQFTPIYFSAQYNAERWSLTSEYAIRHLKFDNNFGLTNDGKSRNPINGMNVLGESYYFQGEYRFTPKWEGIVRYDAYYADRSNRDGSGFRIPYAHFAKDIMVGIRWNVTPQFMLRAEYHHVNGTGWLSKLDNNPAKEGPLSQHWDLYAIQASYRF